MPIRFTEAVGFLVRALVQHATGMPENSVRPANQMAPTGTASAEFATVHISSMELGGQPDITTEEIVNPSTGEVDATNLRFLSDLLASFAASVQFYKSPDVDLEGLPNYNSVAFERAVQLHQLLLLPANRALMKSYGLGYEGASQPRDLTAIVDGASYESRGQVDLYFNVVNRAAIAIATYNVVNLSLNVAKMSGQVITTPVTIEVQS